jgi:integrase
MNDYIFRSPAPNAPMVAITDVSGHISLVRKYISKQAVCDAMAAFSTDIGINEHYRTHTFRKSCINLIARECPDIFRDRAYGNEVACAFVGHKSVRTTEEYYLRLSEQERRIVHERLEVRLDTITAWLCDRDKEKNRG